MMKKFLIGLILLTIISTVFSASIIQIRRDTNTNWYDVNPILAQGEWGLDTTNNAVKFGDGVNNWNNLDYYSTVGNLGLYLQKTDFNGYFDTRFIAKNISLLTNDSNYQTYTNLVDYAQPKGTYLTTETDPVYSSEKSTIVFENDNISRLVNDANYLTSFSETDPIYSNAVSNIVFDGNNISRLVNDANYITDLNLIGYWKNDGSSTATGNWDLGANNLTTNKLSSTTADITGALKLGNSNGTTRKFSSSISATTSSLIKMGEVTLPGNYANFYIYGRAFGMTEGSYGYTDFSLIVRTSNLPSRTLKFSTFKAKGPFDIDIQVWHAPAVNNTVYFALKPSSTLQNFAWDITVVERGNWNVFVNQDTYEVLSTTGLTQVTAEPPTYYFDGSLAVDANVLFVNATNNMVGIGTAVPDKLLTLSSAGGAQAIKVIDTTNNKWGSFGHGDNYLNILGASNTTGINLGFSDSALENNKVMILNNGNVGIGTTAPTEKLAVNGGVNVDGNVYGDYFHGLDFITSSKVADVRDEESSLDKLNNMDKWLTTDAKTGETIIDYNKHYAYTPVTKRIITGYDEEIVDKNNCFTMLVLDKNEEFCETEREIIKTPIYGTVTQNGLSMETRVAEMEKMIWELNERNKLLEARILALENKK
jgi:hypothetical protein